MSEHGYTWHAPEGELTAENIDRWHPLQEPNGVQMHIKFLIDEGRIDEAEELRQGLNDADVAMIESAIDEMFAEGIPADLKALHPEQAAKYRPIILQAMHIGLVHGRREGAHVVELWKQQLAPRDTAAANSVEELLPIQFTHDNQQGEL